VVSNSAWAPPPGCHSLRPRHLSTRRQVHQRLRLLSGSTIPSAEYLPSTTLASGNVAPAAGASDSAWGAGVDSSAGGAASSSAIAVEGSSPSQDRSVDFLQSTQVGC
jgi:hypothetical protein